MKPRIVLTLCLAATLAGCSDLGGPAGPVYGETSGNVSSQTERNGTVAQLETLQVDDRYKLGVGTAIGAVAGGLLGSGIGDSKTATVAGAVLGGAAGTVAQSKLGKREVQRVTVDMATGGRVTITQPVDARLTQGMRVRVDGSGETARVVPR